LTAGLTKSDFNSFNVKPLDEKNKFLNAFFFLKFYRNEDLPYHETVYRLLLTDVSRKAQVWALTLLFIVSPARYKATLSAGTALQCAASDTWRNILAAFPQ
jgi:hypothetical protein